MDLIDAAEWLSGFAQVIAIFVIGAGVGQGVFHLWQLALAGRALSRFGAPVEPAQLWRRYAETAPPITLLVPAYNEEMTIVESIRSLLALQYPSFEVVVVNDGSKDRTLEVITQAFELGPVQRSYELVAPHARIRSLYGTSNQPRLIVVDKENGGKADALNAALNLSRAPVVCSMDADSLLEPDALLRAVRPFIEDPERVIAVGGTIRIVNGCEISSGRVIRVGAPKNFLALLQTVEYLRAFLMARLAWSEAGCLMIISGAFGLFRRDAVMEVGGYSLKTVGEDMELVVKLHRHFRREKKAYRVAFMAEPVCWTEAPEDLTVLGRQRARWHRGALETFVRHAGMMGNPRYGRIGTLGFGYILLVDVLGPFIEIAGYLLIPAFWLLGILQTDYLFAFLAISFGFGIVISVGALALEETVLRRFPDVETLMTLMAAAIAENFGYRQLNNLWRLVGTWQFISRQHSWGTMTRRGFRRA
ncbi:glycosyltransferase family 2 protein [Phenylobacterium sp.]|jgi:cellulose synthase/poly-beta-1,6-N-acetylglucosamine synthase-like glycosyltransferase|uniref:glycosyltransferase family 2 protein n=1 Tax=Phenylobacterium sp. TaxID=1871053 RepID=UPI002F922DB6